MNVSIGTSSNASGDDRYEDFVDLVSRNFKNASTGPLFSVSTSGLWEAYLTSAPNAEERRARNCHACRRFVEAVGGIVAVREDGTLRSALWSSGSDVSAAYRDASEALKRLVERRPIVQAFIADVPSFGVAENISKKTGILWHHFHVEAKPFQHTLKNADQRAAEIREEKNMLARSLSEYDENVVSTAAAMLSAGTLSRSEKHREIALWLSGLHSNIGSRRGYAREAILWLAAANAPAGWCHVRSGLIGTLLEDIKSGLDGEVVARRFNEKIDPLAYMRPKAAPTGGNIKEAEKIVEKLGIAKSLERRFARLSDLQTIWTPPTEPERTKERGVFDHLRNKPKPPTSAGTTRLTWSKFQRDILPLASKIEVMVPSIGDFIGFMTEAHAGSPRILQWDHPVSWYVYVNHSRCDRWALIARSWINCVAIVDQPSSWGAQDRLARHGKSISFILEGAYDMRPTSLALFPEILRSELHPIRATIEAHSLNTVPAADPLSAAGIRVTDASGIHILVTMGNVVAEYVIDQLE